MPEQGLTTSLSLSERDFVDSLQHLLPQAQTFTGGHCRGEKMGAASRPQARTAPHTLAGSAGERRRRERARAGRGISLARAHTQLYILLSSARDAAHTTPPHNSNLHPCDRIHTHAHAYAHMRVRTHACTHTRDSNVALWVWRGLRGFSIHYPVHYD